MENKHDNGFFNGFLIGAALGAGAVFFFGTKTGRRLLKTISEEGFDAATLVKEMVQSYQGDDEDQEESPTKTQKTKPISAVKKFFKGAPKKFKN